MNEIFPRSKLCRLSASVPEGENIVVLLIIKNSQNSVLLKKLWVRFRRVLTQQVNSLMKHTGLGFLPTNWVKMTNILNQRQNFRKFRSSDSYNSSLSAKEVQQRRPLAVSGWFQRDSGAAAVPTCRQVKLSEQLLLSSWMLWCSEQAANKTRGSFKCNFSLKWSWINQNMFLFLYGSRKKIGLKREKTTNMNQFCV